MWQNSDVLNRRLGRVWLYVRSGDHSMSTAISCFHKKQCGPHCQRNLSSALLKFQLYQHLVSPHELCCFAWLLCPVTGALKYGGQVLIFLFRDSMLHINLVCVSLCQDDALRWSPSLLLAGLWRGLCTCRGRRERWKACYLFVSFLPSLVYQLEEGG